MKLTNPSIRAWAASLGVFALGLTYFAWRGPWRAVQRTIDFPSFYGGARAWIHGHNPYEIEVVRAAFHAGGGADGQAAHWFLNPPAALPLLGWLGLLAYPVANLLWLALTLVLIGAVLRETLRWAGLSGGRPTAWAAAGFVLALAPFHTSVSQGQLSIAVTACVMGALLMDQRGRPILVGLLLAVAAALKPQMVFTFGAYYLFTGRWRVCLGGIAGLAGLMVIGIAPMAWNGIAWWSAWRGGFHDAYLAMNDPASGELSRYIILSLSMLVHTWTDQPAVVQGARAVMLVGIGGWVCRLGWPRGEERDPGNDERGGGGDRLVIYALLAELALLGAYHRIYDATVLVLPLAIAVGLWRQGQRRLGGAMLVLLAPMMVSGAAAMIALTQSDRLPPSLIGSWFWRHIVLPHPVWLVLGITAITMIVAARGLIDRAAPSLALESSTPEHA